MLRSPSFSISIRASMASAVSSAISCMVSRNRLVSNAAWFNFDNSKSINEVLEADSRNSRGIGGPAVAWNFTPPLKVARGRHCLSLPLCTQVLQGYPK